MRASAPLIAPVAIHFGLVIEEELLAVRKPLDALQVFVVPAGGESEARIEEVVAVLATYLGLIEGLRGLTQEI